MQPHLLLYLGTDQTRSVVVPSRNKGAAAREPKHGMSRLGRCVGSGDPSVSRGGGRRDRNPCSTSDRHLCRTPRSLLVTSGDTVVLACFPRADRLTLRGSSLLTACVTDKSLRSGPKISVTILNCSYFMSRLLRAQSLGDPKKRLTKE